jgi:Uncharacterized protein conserved in bacteria
MDKPKRDVKEILLMMLARREHCRFDAQNKLKQKGYEEEDIKNALKWAEENKYLDDARYTRLYVENALMLKHQGKKRIIYDLSYKHIDSKTIHNAIDEFYDKDSEAEELTATIERRLSGDYSDKSKNRVIRYCLSHGYEFSTVKSILDKFC